MVAEPSVVDLGAENDEVAAHKRGISSSDSLLPVTDAIVCDSPDLFAFCWNPGYSAAWC